MKILLLPLMLLLAATFTASADQRFESWQGLCHFAYDVADDDNELYFANCENVINTYDAGDGQGRLAYGSTEVQKTYNLSDKTYPATQVFKIKGADADPVRYPDDVYTTMNTDCVMVTSNYDAGADDNNETEYRTNDWNLEIEWVDVSFIDGEGIVEFDLACRGGVAQ